MKSKKIKPVMSFKQAVEATPDVATGYNIGLTALGAYKSKISVSDTRLLQGSIDIDDCTKEKYPEENRWDYAFAFNDEVIFIEVHTANTSEVRVVLKKLQWLKDWLNQQAPEIKKLKTNKRPPFYWIQSKGFAIPKTSPQYRLIVTSGLKPISILRLP
jgi:hypothetical protein